MSYSYDNESDVSIPGPRLDPRTGHHVTEQRWCRAFGGDVERYAEPAVSCSSLVSLRHPIRRPATKIKTTGAKLSEPSPNMPGVGTRPGMIASQSRVDAG
jgi:hypothetical protein